MARDKRIVITGEQRKDIDTSSLALVIIRLVRQQLQTRAAPLPTTPSSNEGGQS